MRWRTLVGGRHAGNNQDGFKVVVNRFDGSAIASSLVTVRSGAKMMLKQKGRCHVADK